MALLALAARHGPLVLVAGLLAGVFLPDLGAMMRTQIPLLVAVLLFVSALQMDPRDILQAPKELPSNLLAVLALQLAIPLGIVLAAHGLGLAATPVVLALVLMSAAPSIVGSPNICLMMGVDPAHALRLMVTGTALLPLTVLPVFWLLPGMEGGAAVLWASVRLLATVVICTLAAQIVRRWLFPAPTPQTKHALQGASAISLAVFVIGLMPAARDVALQAPARLVFWLAVAFAVNIGGQWLARKITRHRLPRARSVSVSVIAGNRNIALFLISLPAAVTDPVLAFIACYQIPMYLTPILMRRVYALRATPTG